MKTFLAVFTDVKLSATDALAKKQYTFNTEKDIKVGDFFAVPAYQTPIQVTSVLPTVSKFVHLKSGALTNEKTEKHHFQIKEV